MSSQVSQFQSVKTKIDDMYLESIGVSATIQSVQDSVESLNNVLSILAINDSLSQKNYKLLNKEFRSLSS